MCSQPDSQELTLREELNASSTLEGSKKTKPKSKQKTEARRLGGAVG